MNQIGYIKLYFIVSKGTLTCGLAHPREVFQEAIRHAAAGVILIHKHPSGAPSPAATIRPRQHD